MERILTVSYRQLYSLSLVNFEEKLLFQYLTDHSILRDLLPNQITHLNIDIQNETISQLSEIASNIFALILSLTKRLIHLNFCQLFSHRRTWISIYYLLEISSMSSNLTELKINVETFFDWLYLLDGRLDSLSKLIINVRKFLYKHKPSYINGGWKDLPKLKCFSLTLNTYEQEYDNQIIALLNRMINLEELILFLLVIRVDKNYADGVQIYNDILIHMPRLNKFTFSINTVAIIEKKKIRLSSNEDIENSFIRRGYGQVSSYVFSQQMKNIGHCHVYSLPYQFEHFFGLNNSFHFQDGIFDKVRRLTMNDIACPFEHQFFKLTSHYFPFIKELTIYNSRPQKDKEHSSTLIIFPHLILLDLVESHADYAEQFLLTKNTHLPCLLDLCIIYESLTMLTNNFITDPTRLNCTQIFELNDQKISEETVGDKMYFMQEGIVDIIKSEGEVLTKLSDGSYLGEICLLTRVKRVGSVRCVTYCNLYSLDAAQFETILGSYLIICFFLYSSFPIDH
ncbi:unnamed protein product [Rotaria sordida]|uniref:Cyclic nucleotide-binding domain-containing protein n=1 Tax=Rotaria sordida TaxID=392033 RepID=A0A815NPG7_9BILA|nr:unnamed protein product [Rotaria sordida]